MPRLDYSLYNFDDLVNQLRAIVVSQSAWIDINVESGTGNFLIELFAIVTEMMMYYLERRAQESFIDVAQLRSSLVRLVGILSYKPARAVSAVGQVIFTVNDPNTIDHTHPVDIIIPRGTIVSTSGGLNFFVVSDTVLPAGQLSVAVNIMQGTLNSVSYISPGTANYEIELPQTNVENNTVTATVDSVPWNSQPNFTFSTALSTDFVQETQLDDTVLVTFGDGSFGAIPATNAVIVVGFVLTDGASGNVYSTNVITTIGSPIFDVDAVNVAPILTVTNPSTIVGGADEETAEEIRMNAPLVFKTGDRAVTREDFIAIINNIPDVLTSYAWGERDANPPNATMLNKINIVALLAGWIKPDAAFKTIMANALADKEQLSVMLNFVDADIISTIVNVDVSVLNTYQISTVVTAVGQVIDAAFALGIVQLGVPVYYAQVLSAIQKVPGVAYCHLAISFQTQIGIGDGTTPAFTTILDLLPVTPLSIQVIVNGAQVATDDGYSNIFGAGGVGGYVDYNTGEITVTFITPPTAGSVVNIIYQQNQKNDIVVQKTQIPQLIRKSINVLT